ncbi:UNVERIFIED_CONTAM: hypothetical protein PYX00_006919 [Menopon gallinae]|uniref:BDBT FKBP like N-terminal domain-containing protein n=1 Tax=Menopon gallinae TaxID=328185 RepID=A0AAW2HHF5_9NEOP
MEGTVYSAPRISKSVRKRGTYGRKPSLGWTCAVRLKAEEGTGSVESEYLSANVGEITLGNGNWPVDRAIEDCLETMHVNEESAFRVRISDDSDLNIDISLESCIERSYVFEWSDREKLDMSKIYKADGVNLFKSGRIDQAFYKFSKALKMLLLITSDVDSFEILSEESDLLVSLYNNLASCQFHFGNYTYVIELCSRSLGVNPNVKGYFRRALAYIELKEYENAQDDLLALLKIEPKNKAAIEKYKLVRELDKTNRENYEEIVKNMFR